MFDIQGALVDIRKLKKCKKDLWTFTSMCNKCEAYYEYLLVNEKEELFLRYIGARLTKISGFDIMTSLTNRFVVKIDMKSVSQPFLEDLAVKTMIKICEIPADSMTEDILKFIWEKELAVENIKAGFIVDKAFAKTNVPNYFPNSGLDTEYYQLALEKSGKTKKWYRYCRCHEINAEQVGLVVGFLGTNLGRPTTVSNFETQLWMNSDLFRGCRLLPEHELAKMRADFGGRICDL